MKKIMLVVLALGLGFSLTFCGQESDQSLLSKIKQRGYIAIALEPGYVPFEMKTKTGELIGFDVEMAREFAKELGVEAKFKPTAWEGIIPALLTKDGGEDPVDIIISGMTITEERAQKVNFTTPYFKTGQSFFVHKRTMKRTSNPGRI
jgi:polar amino acid transport system substrate-binding protein